MKTMNEYFSEGILPTERDLEELALHNPIVRRWMELMIVKRRDGVSFIQALISAILMLAEANEELRAQLIELHQRAAEPYRL